MVRQQKQGFNRREKKAFVRILMTVFILGIFLVFFFPGCSLYSYHNIKKSKAALSIKNKKLNREIVELRKEIDLLEHDEKYLETIARRKYRMLKKDEEVYYIAPYKEEGKEDSKSKVGSGFP